MAETLLDDWLVLVPVKSLDRAKSRLSSRTAAQRRGLSLAFALDTVRAALAATGVGELVVIGDDDVRAAVTALGARWLLDPGAGLNAALEHGCAEALGSGNGVAALVGDLPAVRPEQVAAALRAAQQVGRGLVADAAGTGSTLLTARAGSTLGPLFGVRSRAAHRESGAVELALGPVAGLRRDVDTEVDLWDAVRLGVGPATRAALDMGPEAR